MQRIHSVNDLILPENNTPSLAYIAKKLNSEITALGLIKLHLIELNDYLNLSRPMNMNQITQTADIILSEYPTLKLADLIYTFKCAKAGKFGQLYESIDGLKIISWINQVLSERADAGEAMSISEHGKSKKELIGVVGNTRRSATDDMKNLVHEATVLQKLGKL